MWLRTLEYYKGSERALGEWDCPKVPLTGQLAELMAYEKPPCDPSLVFLQKGSGHGRPGGKHHRPIHPEVFEQFHFSASGGGIDLWSGSRFSWCVSPTSYIFIFFCSLGDFLSFIFCLFYLYLYFCCHILISKNSFFSCRCFLDTVSFSISQRWYSCLFPGFSCCVCCLLSPTSFFADFCFHVWCQRLSAVSGGIWPSFSFK